MARTEKLSNPSLRRRRLKFCANDVVSVMVAAPAIAMVLTNCRRDVMISIVAVLKGKDGTRIERIATDLADQSAAISIHPPNPCTNSLPKLHALAYTLRAFKLSILTIRTYRH